MSNLVEIKVPDIGDSKDVEVIEILVAVGDAIKAEQSLVTLESDKASMEIPSSQGGVVKAIKVKLGDKVSEGTVLLELDAQAGTGEAKAAAEPAAAPAQSDAGSAGKSSDSTSASGASASSGPQAASSPSESAGKAATNGDNDSSEAPRPDGAAPAQAASSSPGGAQESKVNQRESAAVAEADDTGRPLPHASPSVRKFARELGADLYRMAGSGPKGRITLDDVRAYVKGKLSGQGAGAGTTAAASGNGAGLGLLPWPQIDFTKFGAIESKPLSRIKKIAGANLHRNWVMIPHVTNNDIADITDLEALRLTLNKENEKAGVKVTMLAFLIKAVVAALKKFPEFNASLDGDNLILKHYFNIGFAADTPNGLVVPVIRDADKKGILDIARETGDLAKLARDGKLAPTQMQGGCFSISSLGGIGGTTFTPIINAPEVAILGVSRSAYQPVWDGKQFVPRLILPLSLSYDHRVIDGALAARFNAYLTALLADFRRIAL